MPTLTRSYDLLGDAEVCDVYVDAVKQIENLGFDLSKYQFMVALQPDHPDRDSPVDRLLEMPTKINTMIYLLSLQILLELVPFVFLECST